MSLAEVSIFKVFLLPHPSVERVLSVTKENVKVLRL
jgi:hypothetical protein